MEQERKVILKVETGDSQRTVKSLKQDISNLKDSILNLEEGTDDYVEAVRQLQQAQRDLNKVQALTKESAVALDGSYDALVHQMSLLRKEWKATNDEARRNELGVQIDEINSKLKDFDSSIGNFQRNVGNYQSALDGMNDSMGGKDGKEGLVASCKSFQEQMSEMNQQIEPTKQKFEAVSNIASGVASGFAAVQGAAALLGIEGEDLQKTLVKVQAAMAIAQGIGGMKGLVEGIGKAKVAFSGLIDKIKLVSKTMGAAGWLGVIVAVVGGIVALVDAMSGVDEEAEKLAQQKEEMKEANDRLGESIGSVLAEYKLLQKEYTKLTTNDEKLKWINENASAFEQLGLNIQSVNDADIAFINQTTAVVAALKARARAEALTDKYKEQVIKAEQEKENLELPSFKSKEEGLGNWVFTGPTGWDNFYQSTVKKENGDLVVYHKPLISAKDALNLPPSLNFGMSEWVLKEYKKIDEKYLTYYERKMDAAQEDYLKAWEELGKIGEPKGDDNSNGNSNRNNGGGKTASQIRDELVAANWDYINKVTDDDIAKLDDIEVEDIEIDTSEIEGYYSRLADIKIGAKERVFEREKALNNIMLQDEEERLAKENALILANEEKKLDILNEMYKAAKLNGDVDSMLDLEQEIADQEVAIAVEKNRQIIESEEKRKEKQKKIIDEISQALTAAGSVVQGITDIYQESAEKDGEITKKEAKKIKGMQYAIASINMLQGITSALSGAFTNKMSPADWVLAGVQAASIAAAGTANLIKIKNTDITGSTSSLGGASVTPSIGSYSSELPVNYTRNVTTSSEIDELNKETKVYVLESDISEAMTKVQVRNNESSF